MQKDSNNIGLEAEQLARRYLEQNNLRLVTTNFSCKLGEIDLIMRDQKTLCFIEVRYRRSCHFGSAAESIDLRKQQKLIRTALVYLNMHSENNTPCRFDVISIQGSLQNPDINWIKDAFQG